MGSSESSTVIDNEEFSLNHPKIANAVSIKTKEKEYLDVTYPITNTKEYDQWVERLRENCAKDSQWSFHPIKHEYKKTGMCGNSGTAHVQYENYPFLLSDQIENRKKEAQSKFSDYEVWYLISALTELGNKYHEKGEKVGDIRPQNIFLNQEGKMRIATKESWPKEISGYQKAFFDKQKVYLSPEEVREVEVGRAKPISNPLTAENFSIGLTALDTMLLDTSEDLYIEGTFDRSALEDKKQFLKSDPNYSSLLKYVVLNLLEINPIDRVKLQDLEKWISPYRESILNFKPFSANQVPTEIEETESKNPIAKKFNQSKDIYVPQNQIVSSKGNEEMENVESGLPQRVTYQTESPKSYQQSSIRNTINYQPQPQQFKQSSTYQANNISHPRVMESSQTVSYQLPNSNTMLRNNVYS